MRASAGPRLLLLRAAIERAAATTSSSSSAAAAAPACAPATTAAASLASLSDRRSSSGCSAESGGRVMRHNQHNADANAPWSWSRAAAVPSSGTSARRAFSSSSSSSAAAAEMHGTTVLAVRHRGSIVIMADGQISMGSKVVKPNARKLRRLLPQAAAAAADPSSPSSSASVAAPQNGGDLSSLPGGGLVIGGFAGSTADGITLFERLEARLREHPGQLRRAAVDLAKAWRQDRVLRRLRAAMLVADATGACLEISGAGDVLEPADGVHAIGSGARYALAAARALVRLDEDERRMRGAEGGGGGGGAGGGEGGGAAAAAASAAKGDGGDGDGNGDQKNKGLFTALEIAQRAMRVASDRCVYTNGCWSWEGIDERTGASFSGGSGGGGGGGGGKQQQQRSLDG